MAVTDYFTKYSNGSQPLPTTLSAQKLAGASTASLTTATGWDTTTVKRVRVYNTTVSGAQTIPDQASICIYDATLSGTTLSNLTLIWSASGSDQTHAAGATVDLALTASFADDLATGILTSLDQDGTLKAGAVDVTAVVADSILSKAKLDATMNTELNTGWVAGVLPSVSTVTANGNRSYDITFGSSVASTLSSGMRLRTTRTVAAPTQCTSLNGTSQYWSKSTPTGITFVGDHSYRIKKKFTQYANEYLFARFSGNSGFGLLMASTGQLQIQYGNGASVTQIQTYQSVPLNKTVDIAVAVSVAAKTAVVLIDGASVPTYLVAGTATTVVQPAAATALVIGADNTPANYAKDQISQAALFTTAIATATLRAYGDQTMTGAESNCIGFWSFNGNGNDSSTNANNLTASGGATATTTGGGFGNNGTSSTLDYALVMAVSGSTATVQVPEGCTIPTSGGVTSVAYSVQGNPYGWVSSDKRWELETKAAYQSTSTTATSGVYYRPVQLALVLPANSQFEKLGYTTQVRASTGAAATYCVYGATLSTTTSTETNPEYTAAGGVDGASGTLTATGLCAKEYPRETTTSETWNLLFSATGPSMGSTSGMSGVSTRIYALPAGL